MTLYRTYRPQQFSQLLGQETAVSILQQALRKQRIAHAYLFTGPRGTGKTTSARIFARALCCLSPKDTAKGFEPCGTCASCTAILEDSATDFHEIDAASNRSIEDIRTLREQAQYPPALLKYRLYLIDECHMLSLDAFNALLKTLEEPPAHCIFILATTELHKVPLTIRSRCQLIRFERGSTKAIQKKLDKIVSANEWTVDAGVTSAIAEAADGGFRDAETILEQLSTQHDTLTLAVALEALGTVDKATCARLLDFILAGNVEETQSLLSSSFTDSTLRFTWVIQELTQLLLEHGMKEPRARLLLERLLEASLLQKNTPVAYLPLHVACLAVAGAGEQPEPAVTQPKAVVTTPRQNPPQAAQRPIASAPVTGSNNTSMGNSKVVPKPAEATSRVPVIELRSDPLPDVRKAWREMIDHIAAHHMPLAQMLRGAVFHTVEGTGITIHVRYKFHMDKLSERKNKDLVEDLLKQLTTTDWTVHFVINQSMPKTEAKARLSDTAGNLDPSSVAAVFQPAAS